jgi:hypothetical protein
LLLRETTYVTSLKDRKGSFFYYYDFLQRLIDYGFENKTYISTSHITVINISFNTKYYEHDDYIGIVFNKDDALFNVAYFEKSKNRVYPDGEHMVKGMTDVGIFEVEEAAKAVSKILNGWLLTKSNDA